MLNTRKQQGYFSIPLWIHRDDITKLGYNGNQLTDGDMEYLAKRIADDYLTKNYGEALRASIEFYMRKRNSRKAIETPNEM
jgi:hypothetical protein